MILVTGGTGNVGSEVVRAASGRAVPIDIATLLGRVLADACAARDTARAMSRENVEIVQAGFDAWNAGDMQAFGDLFSDDVVVRPPKGWPEPGPFVGRQVVMRQFESVRETWDTDEAERVSEFIDAGDRVLARHIWRGAGHGPTSEMEWTVLCTLRKGTIILIEYFWDHAEALEVVGRAK